MSKAPTTRTKNLYYRRANFNRLEIKSTLQQLLKNSLDGTDNVGSRTFIGGKGTEIRCSNYDDNDKGLFLEITTYTPGQATSTIDSAKDRKQSLVDEENAPNGKDFVDGEAFVFVNNNNIILCMSNAREPLVNKYFKALLASQLYIVESENLELEIVANVEKMKLIQKEGVKEILLSCSLYDASLQRINQQDSSIGGLLGSLADKFQSVFGLDDDLKSIDDKENLNVKISVSFDGTGAKSKKNKKIAGYGVLGKARLLESAKLLVSDEDAPDFKIVTTNGNIITSDSIRVTDTKKIKTLGKSLMKIDAWDRLYLYHGELKATGVLEQ